MQQVWVKKYGPPENLQQQDVPETTPRSGEVRIRVEKASVSFIDLAARMGSLGKSVKTPFVPGLEVAGYIDILGQGVPNLQEGDPVFALTHFKGYGESVCVPYYQVFRRLEWMSVSDGAALPLNYLMAYLMVKVLGSVQVGTRVLVHNAGGGVGTAAVDVCRILGAELFGTSSPEKHDFLKQRGVHHCIDYRNFDYERVVSDLTGQKGVDVVLDGLGGVHWPKNGRLLAPTGRLVYYGLQSTMLKKTHSAIAALRGKVMVPIFNGIYLMRQNKAVAGVDFLSLFPHHHLYRSWMRQIMTWYDEALFRPYIDREFALHEVAQAHHYLHDRKNKGKVILSVT